MKLAGMSGALEDPGGPGTRGAGHPWWNDQTAGRAGGPPGDVCRWPGRPEGPCPAAGAGCLAPGCRFRDCHHDREPGCAVTAAVDAGRVAPHRVALLHALLGESAGARGQR